MSILERVYAYVTGRFIKSINYQTIFGAGNIEGGGGGGVSKEYVDEQDEALSERITTNSNDINDLSSRTNQLQTDLNELGEQLETLETEVENLDNDKADKTEIYTKTETNNLLDDKADKSTTYTKSEADTELEKKLNLSGGNMTGTIIQSEEIAIKQSTATKQIIVYGGTSISDGATLALRGKNRSSNGGTFLLNANDGTNTKTLQGYSNGNLTWNNKNIITEDIVEVTLTANTTYINVNYSKCYKIGNKLFMFNIAFSLKSSDCPASTVLYTIEEPLTDNNELYLPLVCTDPSSVPSPRLLQIGGSGTTNNNKIFVKTLALKGGKYYFTSGFFIKRT